MKDIGRRGASILLLGEAPGKREEELGLPFVGASGDLLVEILIKGEVVPSSLAKKVRPGEYSFGQMVEDGLITDIYVTNVSLRRPPGNDIEEFFYSKTEAKKVGAAPRDDLYPKEHLLNDLRRLESTIQEVDPKVIVPVGNIALWALTGERAISKWRGSLMQTKYLRSPSTGRPYTVVPTYHPAYILRVYQEKVVTIHDWSTRIRPLPKYKDPWEKYQFLIRPSFEEAEKFLSSILSSLSRAPIKLAVDLETTRRSQITSISLALSKTTAICIPFTTHSDPRGYWTFDEEVRITRLLREILSHPNARIIGQNYQYDQLYLSRLWMCRPHLWHDTRTRHHVAFPSLPADLAFLSSLYCEDHCYWKDENKEANLNLDDERAWRYNCRDACVTFEVDEVLDDVLEKMGLTEQAELEMELHQWTFEVGQIGIRARKQVVDATSDALAERCLELEHWFEMSIGPRVGASMRAKPWYRSSSQTATLLFSWFKVKPMFRKGTKGPSTATEFFPTYIQREPLLKPILSRLEEYRELQHILSSVVRCKKPNGRFVTDYVVPGTLTFRFASRKNGMDEGVNFQNLTTEQKKMFGPDLGHLWWEADLDRADAQIVACEAQDHDLLDIFASGRNVHVENARLIFESEVRGWSDEAIEHSPFYKKAKASVHATNYGASAYALARALGITAKEAQRFIDAWFALHPAIYGWHQRVRYELARFSRVKNIFGFHCHFFQRPEEAFKEALAWVPQSTVGLIINKGILNLRKNLPEVQVLTQTHDSAGGQFLEELDPEIRSKIRDNLLIKLPYEREWVIPCSLKLSAISWGDLKDAPWE